MYTDTYVLLQSSRLEAITYEKFGAKKSYAIITDAVQLKLHLFFSFLANEWVRKKELSSSFDDDDDDEVGRCRSDWNEATIIEWPSKKQLTIATQI